MSLNLGVMKFMANFPTGFTEMPQHMEPWDVQPRLADPFYQLADKGFVVVAGLRESDVADLTEIAGQKGVLEFCPKDLKQRWTNIDAAREQLAKDGGRAYSD